MKTLCPFTVVLIAAFLINHVFARKCWVGSGSNNISLPLTADSEKEKAGSEEKKTSERKTGPFKMMKCGDSGSQLVNFDSFIDDAKKKIADAVGSAKSALGIDSGKRRRRKRAADDGDKWACAKVMLPGKTHRSCVKKAVDLQINCTSALGQYALCYCHGSDLCNAAVVVGGPNFYALFSLIASVGAAVWAARGQ